MSNLKEIKITTNMTEEELKRGFNTFVINSDEYRRFEMKMELLSRTIGNSVVVMTICYSINEFELLEKEYEKIIKVLNDSIELDFEDEEIYQDLIRVFDVLRRDFEMNK